MPATVLFVNAGNQLSQINNLEDILTMKVIVSLSAIGLLPIVTKRFMKNIKPKINKFIKTKCGIDITC